MHALAAQPHHAPVGRPTGNAVVERLIRTLKEELIWLRNWDSTDELRVAIATWLHHYLHHRPHQASTGRRPSSAAPSASLRPSRSLRDPEPACTHYPISVHVSVLTLGGHYSPTLAFKSLSGHNYPGTWGNHPGT